MTSRMHSNFPQLNWTNLQVGFSPNEPLIYPFSGSITGPGLFAIKGQNGCGKTTLLKTFLGLLPPVQGDLHMAPTPFSKEKKTNGGGIAYIPQAHSTNPYFHITVEDFILQGYGPQYKPTPKTEVQVQQLLSDWQLTGSRKHSFHKLSGGQKTRCLIARAIASSPQILFLDEPLASLDACCQLQLMNTLAEMVMLKKMCVLMIDHHFENFEAYFQGSFVFERIHDDPLCKVFFK